ncbi:hypothetical protein BCR35DRAFT_313422 [Leucosporidium creatinivorum]|uniref:Ankyrin repeat-containing domain protein n=1 Tax=Leucosporidium creatinivorum TaxID=106004 RepID=A0A1Y2FPX6_9BASI|nr:hypothetical protein BCR35DRAFT_313422 [Leucosporidium creatinivorum]
MPRTASSLSRERSPSTSGIREGQEGSFAQHPLQYGTSVTPRDASPFAHFNASEAASSPDLSSTPSATTPHHRLSQSRETNTATGSVGAHGYDPAVLKSLIVDACSTGDLDRLQALLGGGDGSEEAPSVFTLANRTLTSSGLTPLHLAAGRGHLEVVEWLVKEAGAMTELEDGEGETSLHKASHRGHLNVCRFLVEAGVAVDVADGDGWTPLHNAASRGWLDIARLLVGAGAQIDTRSKHGYTALMNGASKGQLPIVHFLTKRGADPLLRNAWGETAYDLAAAVFEVNICTVLAQYEASVWTSTTPEGTPRPPYHPLVLHSTHPVVLHENARLARPTLKKLSSLGTLAAGQAPRWSSKALSRNDDRTAFTMPAIPGLEATSTNLPVFRSEVGLPVIGKESELILPEVREVRSAGRPGRGRGKSASVAQGKRPLPGSRRSSATSSLTAVLASTSGDSTPLASPSEPSNSISATHSEAAWFWLSDWSVDLTDPSSSPVDGWSYATSFDAAAEEWSSEPPADLQRVLEGDSGMSLGGQKWVRRRRWVRVMRRRLDIPSWGFGEVKQDEEVDANDSKAADTLHSPAAPPATEDYRARAQFLAGIHVPAASSSDRASIRSGKTVLAEGESEPELDRVELRKAAARLERAADELRAGILSDENAETRRKAEGELEGFLHQLALIRTELGPEDEEDDSDDEFIYSGRDADPDDDDTRSVFTTITNRPASITSRQSARSVSGGSTSDYFSQSTGTAPATSPYPDLTPQLSQAPDFRVPTHETSQIHHSRAVKVGGSSPTSSRAATAAVWEADELANECRRCQRKFTFFIRKHHCRRCGQIVCHACSTHTNRLEPSIVVHEPGSHPSDDPWDSIRYRTCDTCHAALSLPAGLATSSSSSAPGDGASVLTAGAFFPASPSVGSASPSEAGASDVSDLTECPVCGRHLAGLGGREEQEEHVKDCLETGGGSIVQGGRYLVFKLPPGPLVSEECRICFEEFVVNDKLARLPCLCYFHQGCIKSWLDRGKSCPFHASRDVLP